MTTKELKPCAYCGGEAEIEHYGRAICIMCKSCHANQRIEEPEAAIQHWNQRYEHHNETDERGLKKCPHCGGRAYREGNDDGTAPSWFTIHCRDCNSGVPVTCDTRKEAEDLWNTRKETK